MMLGLSYTGSYGMDYYGETRWYNSLLQLTHLNVAGTTFSANYSYTFGTAMDMQYVYTAGANNGRIGQSIDGVTGETVNYTYDAVNRLATAGATNQSWGQGYTYDGFGNLIGKTAAGAYPGFWYPNFDSATNGKGGDANGNPTGGWLNFDVENRMITGSGGETYVYDQGGKRVKKASGNSWEFYFYGVGGQKLVTLPCVMGDNGLGCPAGAKYNVYFGGKLVKSKDVVVVMDRLGSVRANGNGERMSYYPYGEERTSTADNREKFGTYMRDNATQDYADQRYYAVGMGRFNTPDPYMASGGPADPRSWNRYAYTRGDPINRKDPH